MKNERMVYESDRIRVYQRDQRLFNGKIKVFERWERLWCVYIIPVQNGKILMTYQKQPHKSDRYRWHVWWLIEWWEDHGTCAQRELLEETWYSASNLDMYRNKQDKWSVRQEKYVYIAKWLEKISEQSLDPGGEMIELKWVDIDEYIDMLIHKKCGWSGWREEIMIKIIDWWIDEFMDLLKN